MYQFKIDTFVLSNKSNARRGKYHVVENLSPYENYFQSAPFSLQEKTMFFYVP